MAATQLTIAEVAERTGLTRHTPRYYERDGLMLGIGRAGSGHRRYSERDLGWIELITKLRATGMPIREVRRYAELVRAGDGNEDERLASSIAAEVSSSVVVPNRIAPRLSTLTLRADNGSLPMVVYRMAPTFAVRARSKSSRQERLVEDRSIYGTVG